MDILTPPLLKIGQLSTKEIFLIGFDDASYGVLNKHKNGSRAYKLRRLHTSFSAYNALKEKIENNLPQEYPRAILCDSQFLSDEEFRLVKKLQSDAIMKNVPFITISTLTEDKQITKHAFRHRIDDHYFLPNLEWNKLKKRIEFLNKFKPELNELIGNAEESFQPYKTPFKKRLFDIVFATGALLALSPLLIAIAIAVKLESKGNIFYTSKRAGSGYNTFGFIKFRSMCDKADAKLMELSHLNQYGNTKAAGPTFVKIQDDPRVTKVGKFIRKTSIDELPQLFNVLKGDMSIVGNRPLPLYEAELLTKDNWITRFNAPAGLTGLWQISKRGKKEMSAEERIQLDIDYAKRYSVRMDLKILLKTLPAMIQDEQV